MGLEVHNYGQYRVVGVSGSWNVQKRGPRRFFKLIPGAWHTIELYRGFDAALIHIKRKKAWDYLKR